MLTKLYRFSVFYAVLGILGGVFFREFTKFQNFTRTTSLGVVHTHAFMLGMMFFLVLIILEKLFHLHEYRRFNLFLGFYNAGLLVTIIMLIIRGILQVLNSPLTSGMNAAISGVAGIGHILLCIGLIYFFLGLKQQIRFQR